MGVTLFDTARGYGLSEARIGRHLSYRRGDFVLVSKCGYGIEGQPDWAPGCVTAGIDEALRQMQTDYIDCMMFHSCPRQVLEQPGLIEALERAVIEGKVRVAGYSGENEDLLFALETGRFGVLETSVNLFDQWSLTHVVPKAIARGIGIVAKRPLGNAPWRFQDRPYGDYAETYWERMKTMGLQPDGLAWDELALRFAAFQPGVGTAIAGTGKLENMRRNVAVVEQGPLPDELVQRVHLAFSTHGAEWSGQV
jgi:aryl-alcohol dehydrogenase-like predicted oxidoreductase